jgi:hypothetical protein
MLSWPGALPALLLVSAMTAPAAAGARALQERFAVGLSAWEALSARLANQDRHGLNGSCLSRKSLHQLPWTARSVLSIGLMR